MYRQLLVSLGVYLQKQILTVDPAVCHVIKYTAPTAPVIFVTLNDRRSVFSMYDEQSDFNQQVHVLLMDFTLLFSESLGALLPGCHELDIALRLC
jgi:hypothetical protein